MDFSQDERSDAIGSFSQSQADFSTKVNTNVQQFLRVDPNSSAYQNSRYYTTIAMETSAYLSGAYGLAKGGLKVMTNYAARRSAVMVERAASKVVASAGQVAQFETALTSSVAESIASTAKKASRNRFIPDINATGAHTVFRRNPVNGKVTHYETFRIQTNMKNPNAWESVIRYDGLNLGPGQMAPSHFNKVIQQKIYEPHVHDPLFPGGIRHAEAWEIPN